MVGLMGRLGVEYYSICRGLMGISDRGPASGETEHRLYRAQCHAFNVVLQNLYAFDVALSQMCHAFHVAFCKICTSFQLHVCIHLTIPWTCIYDIA